MKHVLKFLIVYRRYFMSAGFAALVFVATCTLTACGVPVWLSDAGNIIALVGASFTSVASFVAGLTGNVALAAALATISTWITKVQTGVSDLETLISQYKASPTTGLLGEIESSLTDLQANVQQDFSNLGLPASILSVISGVAGEAESLLAEWSTAIAGVKTAATSTEFKAATVKIATLADSLPQAIANYKAAVNKILTTPTGDPVTDAALAKTKKL
jgi:hypothetical protein